MIKGCDFPVVAVFYYSPQDVINETPGPFVHL